MSLSISADSISKKGGADLNLLTFSDVDSADFRWIGRCEYMAIGKHDAVGSQQNGITDYIVAQEQSERRNEP